eukprot:NODE_933_length_3018_cov_0.362453.p1 type:complete len:400 gc:universal NODE_933_length_3018_cov_0.362453:1212-13(-)
MHLLSLVLAVDILTKIGQEDLKYRKQMKMKISSQTASPFKYFTQPVSHFQSNLAETWQQAYYSIPSSSVSEYAILYIGGEGPLNVRNSDAVMSRLAKRLNAVQYGVEHRGYALNSSFPTQFVTADEAVEDLATFANSFGPTKKWILIGGSYSGSLVHYTVGKYPELFHTGWSSSAPLHAKEDFYEYDQVVARALPEGCRKMIQLAAIEMDRVQKEDRKKFDSWKLNTFQTTEMDDADFLFQLSDDFAGIIQYNYFPSGYINSLCNGTEIMENRDSSNSHGLDENDGEADDENDDFKSLQSYFGFASARLLKLNPEDKTNSKEIEIENLKKRENKLKKQKLDLEAFIEKYLAIIKEINQSEWPTLSMGNWGYQCCTQFGWWQTAPKSGSLRSQLREYGLS